MSRRTYRSGPATVSVDTDEAMRILDLAADGAASRFVARAEEALRPVMLDAQAQWPFRTGRTRDSFRLRTKLTKDRLSVSIVSDVPYAYYTRWSVRTQEEMDAEARTVAQRGGSGEAQRRIEAFWRAKLTKAHGDGAPTEKLAGKRPWDVLVLRPGKRAAKRLVRTLQADVDRLGRRT